MLVLCGIRYLWLNGWFVVWALWFLVVLLLLRRCVICSFWFVLHRMAFGCFWWLVGRMGLLIDLWLVWMVVICVGCRLWGFDIRFPGKLCLLWVGIIWFVFWWLGWVRPTEFEFWWADRCSFACCLRVWWFVGC